MSVQPVTELVSHPEMSALNASAYSNIDSMSVTELVFHPEMSALKSAENINIPSMSVTKLTSHEGISSHPATPHRAVEGSPQPES
jgi:hypothetical protein